VKVESRSGVNCPRRPLASGDVVPGPVHMGKNHPKVKKKKKGFIITIIKINK
jgi:hypothetical protein